MSGNKIDRRRFLTVSAMAGGGMVLSFSWLAGCGLKRREMVGLPKEWFTLNSHIRIGDNGLVTLFSANPEFGSNVKTSMPMILAEELDVDWKQVVVEQADFFPERFERQFTGGSQGIRMGWKPLRTAGATARRMLVEAAARTWKVPAEEISTGKGELMHEKSSRRAGYGEMASLAATLPVPKDAPLKAFKDFSVVGHSQRNVDLDAIVTGKPLFGIDHRQEGMLTAMVVQPPAFGLRLKGFDDAAVRRMPGIRDVFRIDIFREGYARNFFDTAAFPEMVAVVGEGTWQVMNAKKALQVEWEPMPGYRFPLQGRGGEQQQIDVPAGREDSELHERRMDEAERRPGKVVRRDGDPESAFRSAAKVLERTYSAPFLAHNTMEPMNCFAHVTSEGAEIYGPTQAPEFIMHNLSDRLGLPKERIRIRLARMGGGFGRRAYSHHMVEAALISQKVKAPVKLVYTREDDMSNGVYRPAYRATFRAAFDAQNRLTAFHVKAGGVPETPLHADRFPAGAIDNYLAERWEVPSNITIGAFRAPRSNFIASAEQSFIDEVAELMGKDPIELRLEWLDRAAKNPVGAKNDYDPARYAGVLRQVRERSGWPSAEQGVHRGVSAYFCHNSYVAEVVDMVVRDGLPAVRKVHASVDCGIVVNPDAARNMCEGAIVDGIGNALFGELRFNEGMPDRRNFDRYRMIRHREAPQEIAVHFVESETDPTGLGEPLFPPLFAAVANALYKATGKRHYRQPFLPTS